MVEPGDTSEIRGPVPRTYVELISEIDKDPYRDEVWEKVVALARSEEGTERAKKGFYGHVPLRDMIEIAGKLRSAGGLEERYRILGEKSASGELWYDIILGRTNDQSLVVLGEEIGHWRGIIGSRIGERKWRRGLDIGPGPGNSLLEIKKHAQEFVGLDRKDFLLQAARSRPDLNNVPLVTGEASSLPFIKGAFDLVMSNGLTYYLPKVYLPRFVAEVDRVLEPGGSYFEAFTIKEEDDLLPFVEREFLRSGKSVLACLMDRLVTYQSEEPRGSPSAYSIIKSGFEKRGFSCIVGPYKNKGIVTLEFRKKLPSELEALRRHYCLGDIAYSHDDAVRAIYGDCGRYVNPSDYGRVVIEEGKLPPGEEMRRRLYFFTKLAADQAIVEANSLGAYFSHFIEPLVELVSNSRVEGPIKKMAGGMIDDNLKRVYEGRILVNSSARETNKFVQRVKSLQKRLQERGSDDLAILIGKYL